MPRALAAFAALCSLLLLSLPAAAHDGGWKGGHHRGYGQQAVPSPGYGRHGAPQYHLPRTHDRPHFRHEFRYDQFRNRHFRGHAFDHGKHHWRGKGHGKHFGHRKGQGPRFFLPGHKHGFHRHHGGGFVIIIR